MFLVIKSKEAKLYRWGLAFHVLLKYVHAYLKILTTYKNGLFTL